MNANNTIAQYPGYADPRQNVTTEPGRGFYRYVVPSRTEWTGFAYRSAEEAAAHAEYTCTVNDWPVEVIVERHSEDGNHIRVAHRAVNEYGELVDVVPGDGLVEEGEPEVGASPAPIFTVDTLVLLDEIESVEYATEEQRDALRALAASGLAGVLPGRYGRLLENFQRCLGAESHYALVEV